MDYVCNTEQPPAKTEHFSIDFFFSHWFTWTVEIMAELEVHMLDLVRKAMLWENVSIEML